MQPHSPMVGAGTGSTGLFGIGLSQCSPPSQGFDHSRALAGAPNLEPSVESLSAQLLLQRMTAAAQEVASKAVAPSPGVGTPSAGSQGATTVDAFDRLMEKSNVFQRQRDEQREDFKKLKRRAGHEYQGHCSYPVPAWRCCSLAKSHRRFYHGQV